MRTVKEGNRNIYVEYLQLALSRMGYDVRIDGSFGPNTKRSVLALQESYALSPDGIVGPQTWKVLLPFIRGYGYYSVKQGDSIFSIAKAFYTAPEKILIANPGIIPERLQVGTRLIVPYGFNLIPTNVSYSYALVKLLTEGLRARYPFIGIGSAGTSVMGQNIFYLTIGSGEREVFYNAAHHGNEWITTPVLLKFLEEYAESYINNGTLFNFDASVLYDSTKLYLVPLVNPDGVDLVTGALFPDSPFYKQAKAYADDYPKIPFPDGWKANIDGIDPNLSYPAYWERAQEIKFSQGYTSPAPRDYVGPAPLAAVESAAIYRLTQEHDFLLTLSYHTQGEVIYWQFLDYLPQNSREIGEMFSRVSGYSLEETPYASSFAGYKDWFILEYNRPGYTIEAGSGINPLPLKDFDSIYKDNLGILTTGLAVFSDMM